MVNVAHALFDQASNPNLHHIKKGSMLFFLHLSEPVIFVQNKCRITNHQTWKYSLLHCLCTAQLISKMKGCFVIFNSSFTEQNYEHLFLDMAKGIMKANELYAQNSYQLWLITCQCEQIIITWLLASLHNPQLAPSKVYPVEHSIGSRSEHWHGTTEWERM